MDFSGQSRHLHVALDTLGTMGQRGRIGLRRGVGRGDSVLATVAADDPGLRRRLGVGRLRAHGLRGDARLVTRRQPQLGLARAPALVVLAAALVAGLGQEVRLRPGERAGGLGEDHVQRRRHRRGGVQGEAEAEQQRAVQQQRQHHGGAEPLLVANLWTRRSDR